MGNLSLYKNKVLRNWRTKKYANSIVLRQISVGMIEAWIIETFDKEKQRNENNKAG